MEHLNERQHQRNLDHPGKQANAQVGGERLSIAYIRGDGDGGEDQRDRQVEEADREGAQYRKADQRAGGSPGDEFSTGTAPDEDDRPEQSEDCHFDEVQAGQRPDGLRGTDAPPEESRGEQADNRRQDGENPLEKSCGTNIFYCLWFLSIRDHDRATWSSLIRFEDLSLNILQ
jgi:hypothetical protein